MLYVYLRFARGCSCKCTRVSSRSQNGLRGENWKQRQGVSAKGNVELRNNESVQAKFSFWRTSRRIKRDLFRIEIIRIIDKLHGPTPLRSIRLFPIIMNYDSMNFSIGPSVSYLSSHIFTIKISFPFSFFFPFFIPRSSPLLFFTEKNRQQSRR